MKNDTKVSNLIVDDNNDRALDVGEECTRVAGDGGYEVAGWVIDAQHEETRPPRKVRNIMLLGRSVGVPVGWRSGVRLVTTLVATISNIIFPFFLCFPVFSPYFSPVGYFSHGRSAQIKKLTEYKQPKIYSV